MTLHYITLHYITLHADRDITGIAGLLIRNRLNRGEKIVSKIQSWRNKWTRFLRFSRKLAELVGQKLEMPPNRMFEQLTDKTKKRQEIFKNFRATTVTNHFNLPLSPSLDSRYEHPWRKSWLRKFGKAPSENRPGLVRISLRGEFNL